MEVDGLYAQPRTLRIATRLFLAFWVVLALFPFVWMAAMSVKTPVDAFSANPIKVLVGPSTAISDGGISLLHLTVFGLMGFAVYRAVGDAIATKWRAATAEADNILGWVGAMTAVVLAAIVVLFVVAPVVGSLVTFVGRAAGLPSGIIDPLIGFTWQHYKSVWITDAFYHQFINSMMITAGVVVISISLGTPAAYAFSRTPTRLAMVLLIIALVFRAMPQSVLVAGYLPAFINSRETLQPLWSAPVLGTILRLVSDLPPTLYGKPWAIIAVLVAINQPFTIWLLRSFFQSIPRELDEAAMVDGCSPFTAFRKVIMPVMWPGVVTTALFSFLLAYNDYLVASLLLDATSQTMVPTISQYINSDTNLTDELRAIAAAVSVLAPLFVLVLVFQRQIVSGLTQGAVKG